MFEVLGFLGRVGRFSLNCVEIGFVVTFGNYLYLCFSTFIDLPSAMASLCILSDAMRNTSVSQRVFSLAAYPPSPTNSHASVVKSSSGLSPCFSWYLARI